MRCLTASESPAISKQLPRAKLPSRNIREGLRKHRKRRQNGPTMAPGRRPGRPKIVQKSALGPPRATQEAPETSRQHLGASPARPRRGPRVTRERPGTLRDAKKSVREHPGSHRSHQNQRQVASGSGKSEISSRNPLADHAQNEMSSFLVDFRPVRETCEPSEVPRLPAKTKI